MPAMVDPYRARPYTAPSDPTPNPVPAGKAASLRLRLRAAVHRSELTRRLAESADPAVNDELALRARQLTSERNRRALMRSLRRTLAEAHQPAMTRGHAVIIKRAAVLDAQDAIAEMIERLGSPRPVRTEGMAMLELILTNADRSPLYNASAPGALRRMIRVATDALDGRTEHSHEFPLAV
jgi:hypothetical protein